MSSSTEYQIKVTILKNDLWSIISSRLQKYSNQLQMILLSETLVLGVASYDDSKNTLVTQTKTIVHHRRDIYPKCQVK